MQPLQPTFMTDSIRNFTGQQKQRKQPILTDSKNNFAYRFQPIQRVQPDLWLIAVVTFIHTNYNGNNPKVRTFSLIPQRQRIQLTFFINTIKSFIHTK